MTEESYMLHVYWGPRPMNVEECAATLRGYVNALPAIDPIFETWLSDKPAAKPEFAVPIDVEAALNVVKKAQFRYDHPKKVWPEMGFTLSGGHHGPAQFRGRREYFMATAMHVGSFANANPHCNCLDVWIGKKRIATDQPWRASELIPLMKLVLRIWQPREMSVDCWRYGDLRASVPDAELAARHRALPPRLQLLNPLQERTLIPWVGWLTYLPADLAAKVTIPGEIEVERLDDGGIIATLCDEPFTIDNPVHMARARAMEAAIRPVQS